jgi:allophanate hydrolase
VPAAFHGLFGVKPTKGWVPATGVVPACRSLDAVTAMSRDLALAELAVRIMAGPDDGDPLSRRAPGARPALGAAPRLGVPRAGQLGELAPGWDEAYWAEVSRYEDAGAELVEVDLRPFLETARLLYDGAFVAERYAAVGEFVDAHPDQVDPTVGSIIRRAREIPAWRLFRDQEQLDTARVVSTGVFEVLDALILPTTVEHPTLEAVLADPLGVNAGLGRFTNFANLLDLAALATPADVVDGLPFGVQLVACAFSDGRLAELAARVR